MKENLVSLIDRCAANWQERKELMDLAQDVVDSVEFRKVATEVTPNGRYFLD